MATARYFASGSNHPGEIAGLAECGFDVGVAVVDLLRGSVAAIVAAVATFGCWVFVDSGAFGEVTFTAVRFSDGTEVPTKTEKAAKALIKARGDGELVFGLRDFEPITDEEWAKRLATYVEIAKAIGSNAYLVAPDKIGDQAATLDRLARWGHLVRCAARAGANILVPVQKGTLPMAEMWTLQKEILGIPESQLVAAIPMKKDATSTADLAAFLAAAKPARCHLLGLGLRNSRFDEVIAAAKAASPDTELLCDSVLITAMVGRTNGPGKGPRPLTASMDTVVSDLRANAFNGGLPGGLSWADAKDSLGSWNGPAKAKKLADAGELELRRAWVEWVTGRGTTTYRKAEAIRRHFGARRAAAANAA